MGPVWWVNLTFEKAYACVRGGASNLCYAIDSLGELVIGRLPDLVCDTRPPWRCSVLTDRNQGRKKKCIFDPSVAVPGAADTPVPLQLVLINLRSGHL
jgi:hypothetical protein